MVTRVVVAVVSVAVLCLVGCTPGPSVTPTSVPPASTPAASVTPTVAPTPTPTAPVWSAEQQAAVDAVEKWYTVYNEVLQGDRDPNDFVLAGRGEVVDDAQLTYNQFALAELTVEGEITVSALAPAEPVEKERMTVLVDLCADTTGWKVLDRDGKDTVSLESKVVRPLVATVEEWSDDGWFVTSIAGGEQRC